MPTHRCRRRCCRPVTSCDANNSSSFTTRSTTNKSVARGIFVLTIVSTLFVSTLSGVSGFESVRGPPKVLPFEPYIVRPQGENLRLNCPATGNPEPFFEWIKDGEPLELSWDLRIKPNRKGQLRIKDLKPEDAGMYICKVINGFGSAEVGITLLVLDRSQVPESMLNEKGSIGSPPVVVRAESDPPGIIVLGSDEPPNPDAVGSSNSNSIASKNLLLKAPPGIRANFSCEADGLPVPEIQWFKDGKFLDPGSWDRRQVRGPKLSSLVFESVTPRDAGLYSCRAVSPLGEHSKNFSLEIEDANHTSIRPELMGTHPENTTVAVGDLAALQCMVVSDGPLHIEWLKVMEPHEIAEHAHLLQHQDYSSSNRERKTVELNGKTHWILNPGSGNKGMDFGNRTHLSKLVIRRASVADGGTYVCLAANSMGFNYREARLIVREPAAVVRKPQPPSVTSDPTSASDAGDDFPAVRIVTFVCGALVAVVVVSVLALRCRRKSSSSESSVETRYIASKPRMTSTSITDTSGVMFAKHDLTSVKTSDSSLGTPAHLRTPTSKCWQSSSYYPLPSSSTGSGSAVPPAAAGGSNRIAGVHQQPQQRHLLAPSLHLSAGGGRVYHQTSQTPSLSCEEAYEELDFIRRSPGVGDDPMGGMCWEGSLLHDTTATTPSTFDGYDHLPALPSFHTSFGNNRQFRIIPNPNVFMK